MAEWVKVTGTLKQVAVGSIAHIWGVQESGEIWRFGGAGTWTKVDGNATQIDTSADGTTCCTTTSGQVYVRESNEWKLIATNMKQVAVGSAADIWTINNTGSVYRRVNGAFQQVPEAILTDIAAGAGGAVWGINAAGNIYRYNAATGRFDGVKGTLAQIAVGSAAAVWAVQSGGEVWRYHGLGDIPFERVTGTLSQISVGSDGVVWGVYATATGKNGDLWYSLPEAPVVVSNFRMLDRYFNPGEDCRFAFRISNAAFGTTLTNIQLRLQYDEALFQAKGIEPKEPSIVVSEPLPFGIARDVEFKLTARANAQIGKYALQGVKVSATVNFNPGLAPLASPAGGWMPFEVNPTR